MKVYAEWTLPDGTMEAHVFDSWNTLDEYTISGGIPAGAHGMKFRELPQATPLEPCDITADQGSRRE